MRVLVTGGGGFLGGAIVRQLLARGDRVRSVSRGSYPELARLGVEHISGDLAEAAVAETAVAGVDAVIHTAAKAGVWGDHADYRRANVDATRHLLDACRRQGVRRLVHTSSPSVVFAGHDLAGVDESVPYPPRHHAPYPATKAEAERQVLAANGPQLATVALRPHLIWGPGDHHLVPRILARGRAGRLRRIGRRPCPVDTVYIDNAAAAHLLALDRLALGAPCAGRAYFITNGEPRPLWDMVDAILAADGLPPVRRTVPTGLALAAGALLEGVWRLLGRRDEPLLTRFVVRELATAHWFNIDAARRDLGYTPIISIDEGLERLHTWLTTHTPY